MTGWLMACHGTEEVERTLRTPWEDRVAWERPTAVTELPVATLPAEVIPLPGSMRAMGPPADGRLVAWLVQPGDRVELGQPLAELRSPELVDLDASVGEAAASLRAAKARVELLRSSVERGVASRGALQEAEAALATAQAEASGRQRRFAAHRDTTSEGFWLAPADGVVADITCELGPVVAGEVCLSLIDPAAAALHVALPERYASLVVGDIYARYAVGDETGPELALLASAPMVDRERRARDFWFAAPDAPLGSYGRATVWIPAPLGVVQVPEEAVTVRDGVHEVFVRVDDGLPRVVQVEVVGRSQGVRFVRGLAANDEVAVKGVFLIKSLVALEEA